jgi:hypothetical protein
LRDPSGEAAVGRRVERQFPDLFLSSTTGFAEQQQVLKILVVGGMALAGLAILIGGLA